MIFLGDTAIPPGVEVNVHDWAGWFPSTVILNLEGAVRSRGTGTERPFGLSSAEAAVDALEAIGTGAVTLANNHVFDYPEALRGTRERLAERGIASCGAGENIDDASRPAVFEVGRDRIVMLAFGWQVIGCRPANRQRPGVNPLRPRHVLEQVEQWRRDEPDSLLVVQMHWNYELESWPLPMHRELAHRVVGAGANLVVGHHPHCVQGVEVVHDAPIVYSLGNWFLPRGRHFGDELGYPDVADVQLAFEWSKGGPVVCHWFRFNARNNRPEFIARERLEDSGRVARLTPFARLDHDMYIDWFRENRARRKLLPVYPRIDSRLGNHLRDSWMKIRDQAVRARQVWRRGHSRGIAREWP